MDSKKRGCPSPADGFSPSSVIKRLQLLSVLIAWFMATGAQWDLVQTFGWSRMIANYSKSMPLMEAVRLTFTAENMCRVCEVVSDAKRQEKTTQAPGGTLKSTLVFVVPPSPVFVLAAPGHEAWLTTEMVPSSTQRPVPPTPPPQVA